MHMYVLDYMCVPFHRRGISLQLPSSVWNAKKPFKLTSTILVSGTGSSNSSVFMWGITTNYMKGGQHVLYLGIDPCTYHTCTYTHTFAKLLNWNILTLFLVNQLMILYLLRDHIKYIWVVLLSFINSDQCMSYLHHSSYCTGNTLAFIGTNAAVWLKKKNKKMEL